MEPPYNRDGGAQSSSPSVSVKGRPTAMNKAISFLIVGVCAAATTVCAQTVTSPPTRTDTAQAFQDALFTGAAVYEIPVVVPPGTAGVTPSMMLRHNSLTIDELAPHEQAQWTGLGWTLDIGGFIVRDTKGTVTTADDTFKLVFNGLAYPLVLVDSGQSLYRTRETHRESR